MMLVLVVLLHYVKLSSNPSDNNDPYPPDA